jgi:peptidoglycan/LPS O-acetylase OafA/YrhL
MQKKKNLTYRKDIDGLRAIAVIAVILFHFGFMPNGYLGVDIFFTISGFLITKIVYQESIEDRFSLINFYLRRIRRIIPLVLFTTFAALIIGVFVMLPDDFENLCQSIVSTNIFANNILLLITTGNYWDIANEYKPLMHTWSLGVEEQFYVIYPLIFIFCRGKRSRHILPLLSILTVVSILLFFLTLNEGSKFYSIQFRFFELSLGGLAAIIFKQRHISSFTTAVLAIITLSILVIDFNISDNIKLLLIVCSSVGLLLPTNNEDKVRSLFFENKLLVAIGKISFSLYMWHQIVLAYARYFVFEKITVSLAAILFAIILILSIFSYLIIEQPFRNKNMVTTKKLLLITGISFVIICSSCFYLYSIGGIIRDVPELDLYKASHEFNQFDRKRNVHIEYNARIYDLDKKFVDNKKIKVLVIGNSFSRDFANVLLESKLRDSIEISYVFNINTCEDMNERLDIAQFVFFTDLDTSEINKYRLNFKINLNKVYIVGPKNFGYNNGIFYNKRGNDNYCKQRVLINDRYIDRNNSLSIQWGKNYINLLSLFMDKQGKIPVFTPDCKFISQDCTHLTKAGAMYLASILDLDRIFLTK